MRKSLDPDELGQINFEQFVVGIKKITSEQAEEDNQEPKQETEENSLHEQQQQLNDLNSNEELTDWNDLKHLSEKSKPSLFDSSGFIEFEGKSNEVNKNEFI
jgi:hypothetical protein